MGLQTRIQPVPPRHRPTGSLRDKLAPAKHRDEAQLPSSFAPQHYRLFCSFKSQFQRRLCKKYDTEKSIERTGYCNYHFKPDLGRSGAPHAEFLPQQGLPKHDLREPRDFSSLSDQLPQFKGLGSQVRLPLLTSAESRNYTL